MVEEMQAKPTGDESTEMKTLSKPKSSAAVARALSWKISEETAVDEETSSQSESPVASDDDKDLREAEDDVAPLDRKTSATSSAGRRRESRPSLARQTSRYDDRRRQEDVATQAGYDK